MITLLLVVQACRSMTSENPVMSDSQVSLLPPDEDVLDSTASVNTRRIPVEADFFFAYSTVPGRKSQLWLVKKKMTSR
jgi:hypothetical protein